MAFFLANEEPIDIENQYSMDEKVKIFRPIKETGNYRVGSWWYPVSFLINFRVDIREHSLLSITYQRLTDDKSGQSRRI
jgi:hypothetical protein